MKNLIITIKTLFGLEGALKEEIIELGYTELEVLNRAVQLKGNWEDVYRLNYRCRIAISVLVEISSFRIHDEDDLYKKAKKIDWTSYFDISKTFAVKGAVFSTLFKHSQFPMLLVKDAIVDVFRDQYGERPNVNTKAPQVMFDVYIKDRNVTVSLNTSGLPLFQRGWRQETGEAPMNEVLAAGILRLSGWDRKSTLIDPMCGAGTIAIEAALWAADIPSMIERTHYAFKNFKSYDESAWEKVQNEGNKRPVDLGFDILAYDIDGEMLLKAKRNSKVAPIGNMITFERKDALKLNAPDAKGTLICNPPYEERMGENTEELYEGLGNLFKHSFVGYSCWIISSNMEALKQVGLRPSKRIKVFNGNLECSLRKYEIFEGTIKEQYSDADEVEKDSTEVENSIEIEKKTRKTEQPQKTSPSLKVKNEEKTVEKREKIDKKEGESKKTKKNTEKSENFEDAVSSKYGKFSKYQFGTSSQKNQPDKPTNTEELKSETVEKSEKEVQSKNERGNKYAPQVTKETGKKETLKERIERLKKKRGE